MNITDNIFMEERVTMKIGVTFTNVFFSILCICEGVHMGAGSQGGQKQSPGA